MDSLEPISPLVSVIMPVRNARHYVHLAVKSTLFALPKSSELIVINDGSSDGSLDRISSLSDRRLRILNSPGSGLVDALNFGISCSRGTFIARMDADDVCLPWRFQVQLRIAKKRPNTDFLFATAVAFGSPIRPFYIAPQIPWSLNSSDFRKVLTRRNPAVHPTMVARASTLKALGGYVECPAEDEELWLRASLAQRTFNRLGIPVIGLRLHPSQTTRQKEWKNSANLDNTVRDLRQELQEMSPASLDKQTRLFTVLDFFDANGLDSFRKIWLRIKAIARRLLYSLPRS